MADDPQRTVHAQEAFRFSDVFGYKFAEVTYGASNPRRLKLNEPEMSTDGGRKARQSIVLIPDEEAGRSLLCGWLDVPRKTAELRTYNLLSQQYESRHGGEALEMAREDYDRAFGELQGFLRIQKFDTTVLDAPARRSPKTQDLPAAVVPSSSPLGAMIAMLVIGILIGVGLGYLVFQLRVFG